jgi:quinol monooxygenase YgiN
MQIIYQVRVKNGKVEAFKELATRTLIPEARKLSGCQLFDLYQNTSDDRQFIFHELWDSEEDVHLYKLNLIAALGEPHPGEEFPASMNELIASDKDLI